MIIVVLLSLILLAILFPGVLRWALLAAVLDVISMAGAHASEAREPTQISASDAEQWCLRDIDGYIDVNKEILQKAAACSRRVLALQHKIQNERVPCGDMCKPSVDGSESCMPNAPNGRAPQWVEVAKRQTTAWQENVRLAHFSVAQGLEHI
jgi:hypothetical protein